MAILPLAGGSHVGMAFFIQRRLDFIQAAGEVFFGNITKLEARQRCNRIAQRTQEQFSLELIAAGRGAIQIGAGNVKVHIGIHGQRGILRRQIQRHTLRHKIFDVEIPLARLIVAGAGADMPHTGRRPAIKRPGKLIQTIDRFADQRADHLTVRLNHVELHRLLGQRFAVAVTEQRVEDDRLSRTIKIARTKHKELLAESRGAGNRELGQIQCGKFEIQQGGLPVFSRQQQRRFFIIGLQGHVPLGVAFRLGESLPFRIQQLHIDTRLRRTVFETLGKDIQPVTITVRRYADIAQRKQRRSVAIAVASRRIHHRYVNARLLQRLNIRQRQQQFLPRVARRIEIETPGIDQIGHFQQLVRLPVTQ